MKTIASATRLVFFVTIFSVVFGLGKFHAQFFGNYDLTSSSRFGWLIAYSIICYLVAYSFGLPDQRITAARVKASIAAAITSALLVISIQTVLGEISLPRFVIGLSIPTLFVTFVLVSRLSIELAKTEAQSERILLISSLEDAQTLEKDMAFHTEVPCVIAAHLPYSTARDKKIFSETVESERISLIVLENEALDDGEIIESVISAHAEGVRVRTQLAFYEDWVGKIPVRELAGISLLFDIREIHHIAYSRLSRLLDISASLLGLIVLLLVTPVVVLFNLVSNPGPLLYRQERVGKSQTTFHILKFRSMIPGSSVGEWTKTNDVRITKFGKFLRLSHLDELPQVINILRGDLSLIGPRPEQPHYVEQLSRIIPYYQSRHLVRPGLTGWAQVNYPYGADEIDAFEKLQYEFWYLRHQSMWLDLRIIARTFRHITGFKGR
jgi:lipopolysaccharide/colanic/teichoic acid biosynthesis glycosyltransferase